ncbi:hypothetical protein N7448_000161 [Penicillium atrosanguineum]|uniref:Cyanovirin-N domain-containing protein n=1 Tax=Penicillium atrosanguineum TaxID=1132637 RepID=A0A9W9Q6Q2_9EURO|nr:uncharacterized protein N7443_003561 [Penicillium atrosanguineum]KAJ5134817.1 hypothetical protein N7526_006182 [Penicillium atrosanguineum]KAJ5148583.1 hypothetical protein N7448_000161 [Penicillium atrosanguineum]KAJ5303901.1 hypothetical protein N7443_003561 [Penicillium atrosanguineum]KAJ5323376.1 hypothetical protein N7476_001976 [Penicillium atrosanguineum]
MSFYQSALSFELDDDHILKAVLQDEDGEERESELDLNHIIGNNDGTFEWGGQNFKDSASDIELHREGDEEVPILRARLNNVEGEEIDADINLAERITNDNGNLVFV